MKVSFQLTMPNVGSWNGKWTGADKKYYVIRGYGRTKVHKEYINKILNGEKSQSFYYDFGDGWSANVKMELIDEAEAKRRQRLSAGFAGYDWMINSIMQYGEILNETKRKQRQSETV